MTNRLNASIFQFYYRSNDLFQFFFDETIFGKNLSVKWSLFGEMIFWSNNVRLDGDSVKKKIRLNGVRLNRVRSNGVSIKRRLVKRISNPRYIEQLKPLLLEISEP
jgi:hypothetical protein